MAVDTSSATLAVDKPEIPEVMDTESGDFRTLAQVVWTDRGQAMQRRMAIKEGQIHNTPLYVCAECFRAVYMPAHKDRRFYFKHELEDGRCSAVTRGELSQKEINARKYDGAKESVRHQRIKHLVMNSLSADTRFSDILHEKRWIAGGRWRQPDVQAIYRADDGSEPVRVAFEIQLSTTFLDVIAERRIFYREQGGLLFWVFGEFGDADRRLMVDDIFYNNNRNAFIVTEGSMLASYGAGAFLLDCAWEIAGQSGMPLQRRRVGFSELQLDLTSQRAYYYDVAGEREKAIREGAEESSRRAFEAFFLEWADSPQTVLDQWEWVRIKFRETEYLLPDAPGQLPYSLLQALYSAKHGRPVGWKYTHLIQVAHLVVETYPKYLRLFRKAMKHYRRVAHIAAADRNGKWAQKAKRYLEAFEKRDAKYAPDRTHDTLISFLFPELLGEDGKLV